jgi:hypothetical protein
MATTPKKFDGLIESVRYGADGLVLMVKVYERRGPAFSDSFLMDRQTLVERLKRRQRFYTGKRVHSLGGTFELGAQVRLLKSAGQEIILSGAQVTSRDLLEGVPIF